MCLKNEGDQVTDSTILRSWLAALASIRDFMKLWTVFQCMPPSIYFVTYLYAKDRVHMQVAIRRDLHCKDVN